MLAHARRLLGVCALLLLPSSPLLADAPKSASLPASLFDPARYMRVSEVKPGMKGYGLSVFLGTKIEKFNVEVISILHNFNPKTDVILIRFNGDNLEHNLAIAGMSGSPIYLYDSTGKARMVGAFAYGWPMQKDPIAGVQPIEYMLKLPDAVRVSTTLPAGAYDLSLPAGQTPDGQAVRAARWSLEDVVLLPGMKSPPTTYPLAEWGKMTPNPAMLESSDDASRLRPLSTPLMIGGFSPAVLREMDPLFRAYGLVPLQAGGGGGGGGGGTADKTNIPMEPGSVLGIPLVEGDVDMSAVGTCTDVIGNHVLAFGHPFNSEGNTALPLAGGSIQGIVANLSSSFKLGSLSRICGTLQNDATVGIAGELGAIPPVATVDLRIKYTDGSEDQSYHFTTALHPKLTPMLVSAAMTSAITGAKDLPSDHTVDYDLTMDFDNGKSIHIVNSAVNISANDMFFEVGTPLLGASDNPFERVMIRKISGTVLVSPGVRAGRILYADVPRSRFRPGETVSAYVNYRPYRAGDQVLPVTLKLPRDLPDGTYQLTISDWQKYMEDERAAEPFKFTAESIDQVFEVLRDFSSIRHDAVYVRLLRQPDGVAVGHIAMPKMPSSRRQIMIGSGRSDTTQFISSIVKVVPTDRVMSGSAEFEITIDKNADVRARGH